LADIQPKDVQKKKDVAKAKLVEFGAIPNRGKPCLVCPDSDDNSGCTTM
jgi:hypothetical protein